MDQGSSPAVRALRQAQQAAAYARRTGCGIDEATAALAESAGPGLPGGPVPLSRRAVLGGAGAAALAAAVPAWLAAPARAASRARASGTSPRVVIIGSGLAGLGCAYRLWASHGIRSEVYEYNAGPGRRPHLHPARLLRRRAVRRAARRVHLQRAHRDPAAGRARSACILDNVNAYPPHTRAQDYRFRFGGRFWPQAALNRDWHEWGWRLFHDAAFRKAPWPTLYNKHTAWGLRWDHMPATEWIEQHIPGGLDSDFGALCVSVLLDEYGGPVAEQSALNLVYLLGLYDSAASGLPAEGLSPQLSGTDEKWHLRGGNDQLISGLIERLPGRHGPPGRTAGGGARRGHGRYTCTFASGAAHPGSYADHVVLALPFTKLREVDTARNRTAAAAAAGPSATEPLGANAKIQLQFSSRVWNTDHWTGNMYTDGVVQGGWETTVDQPGAQGILIALPGGEVGATLGPHYGLHQLRGACAGPDGPRLPRLLRAELPRRAAGPTTARRTTPGRPGTRTPAAPTPT